MTAIFTHIPKTGGLSIDEALNITKYRNRARLKKGQEYSGIITFGHELLPFLQRRELAPRDAFTFAFCRNPYERAVSLWAYNNQRNKLNLTFPEFCADLSKWKWGWRLRYPQAKWVEGVDLDFLGRFENLQEDFNRLCDALDIERRELPHVNATEHGPCSAHYDDMAQGIIRGHYSIDFKRFGYEIDHLPN